jgi:fused signal recognition particle receptor
MLALIIVLTVVAVIVLVSAGFVITSRRRRGLEAPPEAPTPVQQAPPATAPPAAPAPTAPTEVPAATARPAGPEATAPADTAPSETALAEAALAEAALAEAALAEAPPEEAAPPPEEVAAPPQPPRIRDRIGRTRAVFAGYLSSMRGRDRIDSATWDELEEALILADVGVGLTEQLLDDLRAKCKEDGINSAEGLVTALKSELVATLQGDQQLNLTPGATNVWLFVGVNGVGKTTTIGKVAMRLVRDGHRVVMAAGDTFRAAAADQLELWADRVGASFIRGNEGGDPGAVVFDAVQHAAARHADLVLADTAGRLHTKTNLMEELKKVRRVAERPPGLVNEVLLVIDATTGQNGLIQARQFAAATGVTGVVLTKLDGTAKGGIALAICAELGIPIKLVGLGEQPEDLVDFDPVEFVDALVAA